MRTFYLIFALVLGVTTGLAGEEVVCLEYRSSDKPPSKICGYPVGKPETKSQARFSDSKTSEIPNSMFDGKNCPNCGNLLPLPYAAAGIREGKTIYVPRKEDRTGRSDCIHDVYSTSPITFPAVHSPIIPVHPQYNNLAAEEIFGRYFHLYERVKQLEEKLRIAENPKVSEEKDNQKKISSPETLQEGPSESIKK